MLLLTRAQADSSLTPRTHFFAPPRTAPHPANRTRANKAGANAQGNAVDQAGTAARKNKREQRKEQNAAVEDAMAAGIEVKELRDIVELEQKTFKSPKKPRR